MQKSGERRSRKRTIAAVLAIVVGIVALLFSSALFSVNFLVNLWWFDSVGYALYFWQRLLYRYAVFAVVAGVFFFVFFLNFRLVTRPLRVMRASPDGLSPMGRLGRALRSGSIFVYIPLSVVLTLIIALPLFHNWEKFLFFLLGPDSGVRDTLFGKDISYYLFSYPLYVLMQARLLIAFLALLAGSTILYGLEHLTRAKDRKGFPRQTAWHLSVLVGIIILIEIWGYGLQRHGLVYATSHEPLFYGPGYLEMNYVLPLIWLQMALLVAIGIAVISVIARRKGFIIAAILVAWFFVHVGLRHSSFVRDEIERYWIKPDQLERERPFIDMDVQATLHAYGLHAAVVREFRRAPLPLPVDEPSVAKVLRNVPLWEREELKAVYDQLQSLRSYYSFPDINVGRYTVEDHYQQVFLSVRELETSRLPGSVNTWVNLHLDYTHGYGLVMNPASQEGGVPFLWYVRGIPLDSSYGIEVKRPEVYFGVGPFNDFVIAPNASGEFDYAREDRIVTSHYKGHGGVPLSSLFSRAVFAYYFKDKNILISTRLTDQSRILFRRNVVNRIQTLAPYLLLDREIYPVVTSDRLYWIQDAYTISDQYPNSKPTDFQDSRFNYIRNSVKIVVDAYDGHVDLFVFDAQDPIIRAYRRIYPGLFKDKSELPAALKPHIRYPKDYFEIQMKIYTQYHQTDPVTFFEQEDVWEFARTLRGKNSVRLQPYYSTLDLITPGSLDFLIMQPMTPVNLDNLRALVVGACDKDNYGKIIVYSFPKGELVYSPVQMSALINADPTIAEQFNLWDMSGSTMKRGKMVILPVHNTVLYIQPVFLEAKARHPIPELQRVIMSEGHIAVMESSLEDAYRRLRMKVTELDRRIRGQLPTPHEVRKQEEGP
jgi:uncharacterized membrane protein (UPF0182 family)